MLDYRAWKHSDGSLTEARRAARRRFDELSTRRELPCFAKRECDESQLVLCTSLWSVLCPPNGTARHSWFSTPCHGTRGLWHTGAGLHILASRDGAAAARFLARDLNVRPAI